MRFRAFILVALLMLTACGFTPMYGERQQGVLNAVAIDNIPDREGQYLRNRLIDRFYTGGMPSDPGYVLSVSRINEKRTDLDVTKSSNTTRAELKLTTSITLRDKDTGKVILKRDLQSAGSYNILSSQFTTRVSEDNTRLGILDDLARQIEQVVLLGLQD